MLSSVGESLNKSLFLLQFPLTGSRAKYFCTLKSCCIVDALLNARIFIASTSSSLLPKVVL